MGVIRLQRSAEALLVGSVALALLVAGCVNIEAPTSTAPGPVGDGAGAAETPPLRFAETEWKGGESRWVDVGGRTTYGGTTFTANFKAEEEGRVLLYNVTPRENRGMAFVVDFDGVEVARAPVNLSGDTRIELDASKRGSFVYRFEGDPAGAGIFHVGFATRHVLAANATAT